ncbi:MAG: hypothetical protein ACI4FZ_08835 [Lachnospiraceae bacterium]
MTARELSQIYWVNKEIAMWQQELDRLENNSKVKGAELTGVVQQSDVEGSKVENQTVRQEMIREEILELKKKAEHEQSRLRKYIKEIDDSLVRQIIEYKYVQCLTWEETASKIGGENSGESLRKALQRYMKRTETACTGRGYRQ